MDTRSSPLNGVLLDALFPAGTDAFLAGRDSLRGAVAAKLEQSPHGSLPLWWGHVQTLQSAPAERCDLALRAPQLSLDFAPSSEVLANTEAALRALGPWRKGPFSIGPLTIDAEWRSDIKWDRLSAHAEFRGRRVLDVGCGNGYACLRAVGAGARCVLGVDPTWLYVMQFLALRRLAAPFPAVVLPLALEDLPFGLDPFDTTLSMGVLYHRRSPIDHLLDLKRTLRRGGELLLETLVVEGAAGYSLMPAERYACMRNVWFIPAPDTVSGWLRRVGFVDVELLDVSTTTSVEQRATPWMPALSLRDFLDPHDATKTLEGYPAPRRALFRARRG